MAFVGNILGGYGSQQLGRYNESLLYQEAQLARKNAEIKLTTFENITKPKLIKDYARIKSNLLVNLLKSGVDVDRVGETPYLMMLDQEMENDFDLAMATYNSKVTYQNEVNRSLIIQAKGRGEAFKGEMAYRTGMAKAVGDIYENKDTYGSLLG